MANKVQAGRKYVYRPVGLDVWDSRIYGGLVKAGDYVKVVNFYGCPKANTMGHCYIQTMDGKFAGLVLTDSLILASTLESCKNMSWRLANDQI